MTSRTNAFGEEGAILIRAVEGVLRKLIRILIGKLSLKKFQELSQMIYVEESEAWLAKEKPGKKPTLTDTALLTGFDIRTIKKLKDQIIFGSSVSTEHGQVDGFMPMFKLLDLWMNHEEFFDSRSGKPKVLQIEGKGATFSRLVKMALPSRGLSTNQILKRLKEIEIIAICPSDGTVQLTQEDNIFISKDDLDSWDVGFAAIGNLTDTVRNNIQNHSNKEAKFFQRGCWNYQFNPKTIHHARNVINNHLIEVDKKSRALLTSLAQSEPQADQITVGISMFYFEESET